MLKKKIKAKKVKRQKKISKEDCDKLLSPIIKKLYPKCLLCDKNTQVAHHHFHKSKHMCLRYNFKNLIPLCNGCHFKLGFDESYWGCKVLEKFGIGWFQELDEYNTEHKNDKTDFNKIYATLKSIK